MSLKESFFKFLCGHIGRRVRNAPKDFLHLQATAKCPTIFFNETYHRMPKFFLGHLRRKIANAALDFKLLNHFVTHFVLIDYNFLKMMVWTIDIIPTKRSKAAYR